jgi:hypothetical protein
MSDRKNFEIMDLAERKMPAEMESLSSRQLTMEIRI